MRTPVQVLRGRLAGFVRGQSGSAAAEFVLVAPAMVGLILLAINAGVMMYAGAALNFAVADAARCRAVKTSVCTDQATTESYAADQYGAPSSEPVFTATPATLPTTGCSQVNASATYRVVLGIAAFDVPMSASACYPVQPSS